MTSVMVIAEIKRKYLNWNDSEIDKKLDFIKTNSIIVDVDTSIAELAAELRARKNVEGMSVADYFVLATAINKGMSVLTFDSDFSEFNDAVVIQKVKEP